MWPGAGRTLGHHDAYDRPCARLRLASIIAGLAWKGNLWARVPARMTRLHLRRGTSLCPAMPAPPVGQAIDPSGEMVRQAANLPPGELAHHLHLEPIMTLLGRSTRLIVIAQPGWGEKCPPSRACFAGRTGTQCPGTHKTSMWSAARRAWTHAGSFSLTHRAMHGGPASTCTYRHCTGAISHSIGSEQVATGQGGVTSSSRVMVAPSARSLSSIFS